MQIGTPQVKELTWHKNRNGKYAAVWKALDSLEEGKALPVLCDDQEEVRSLQASVHQLRSRPYKPKTATDGLTLWITKGPR